MFTGRTEIIDKINHFSGCGMPFLFAVDFDGETGFVFTPLEARQRGILYDFESLSCETRVMSFGRFDSFPVSFETYSKAFNKVLYHLKRGDTYLLNLTFPTPLETDLSMEALYQASHARFKLFVPGHFAVFSPEPFVRIDGTGIYSCPMKGTIDADLPDARQRLLDDKKEFFEHNTIVDLIRNDLSMVSTQVSVTRFRYIERLHTNRGDLLQMSSEISGQLSPEYRSELGDILFSLLPAGSVTGAPKKRTVEIIRAVETSPRGFYTGIFGYSDGITLTSAVSIRFIEQTTDGLVFRSGGGITAMSEAQSEYHEMIKKIYVPVF